MRRCPRKEEVLEIIELCNNLDFLIKWRKLIPHRSYQIIFMRHGHENNQKMEFKNIAPFISNSGRTQYNFLSDRQIGRLYYVGLGKIKELMEKENAK